MPLPMKDILPVQRQLLRDVVYDRLYESILNEVLEPGEVLLDEKLTAWLGVSRTPIREALMKLADIGLVEMAPNRYTRVAPIDPQAISEAICTLGLLHEQAARTAVPHLKHSAIHRLEKALRQIRKSAKTADSSALGRALNDFFLEFGRNSDNDVLLEISEGLSPQFLRYIAVWELPFATSELPLRIEEIFEAVKAKDAAKTGELITNLYQPAYQQFIAEYRRSDSEIDESPVI